MYQTEVAGAMETTKTSRSLRKRGAYRRPSCLAVLARPSLLACVIYVSYVLTFILELWDVVVSRIGSKWKP